MDKAWVERKEKERKQKLETLKSEIRQGIERLGAYNSEEVDILMNGIEESLACGFSANSLKFSRDDRIIRRWENNFDLLKKTLSVYETLPFKDLVVKYHTDYNEFLDSERKHYHGDIIITDPCYLATGDDFEELYNNFEPILANALMSTTFCGDWSCNVHDRKSGRIIGEFCADAGLVTVVKLDDVLKYNPHFDYHIERPWTTAVIKDFDGVVWFDIKYKEDEYGYSDAILTVRGEGVNYKTGEIIEFSTEQCGL